MTSFAQFTRLALAAILIAAAPHKLYDPVAFAHSVGSYQLLPELLIQPLAQTLPWLELVLAALLLCRAWTGTALILTNLLFAVFLAVLASAQYRGLNVDCGCFVSGGSASSTNWYLARDTLFLAVGLAAALLYRREQA